MTLLDIDGPVNVWQHDMTSPMGQDFPMRWLEVTPIEQMVCDDVVDALQAIQLSVRAVVE